MCMSPLLKSVLRDQMQFNGYIVTDSGAIDFMVSMFHRFSQHEDAAAAVRAATSRSLRDHFSAFSSCTPPPHTHTHTRAVQCAVPGAHADRVLTVL